MTGLIKGQSSNANPMDDFLKKKSLAKFKIEQFFTYN